jgi:hypothetical protein
LREDGNIPGKSAGAVPKQDSLVITGGVNDFDLSRDNDKAIERLVACFVEIFARFKYLGSTALPSGLYLQGVELGESDILSFEVCLA